MKTRDKPVGLDRDERQDAAHLTDLLMQPGPGPGGSGS